MVRKEKRASSSVPSTAAGPATKRAKGADDGPPRAPGPAAAAAATKAAVKEISGYFPRAKMLKTAGPPEGGSVSILLFYTYVEPLWSEARQQAAMAHCLTHGERLNLGGRIRVAREGFNATVSGSRSGVREFTEALRKWDRRAFAATDFKFVDGEPPEKHFPELKVFPVAELVHYGLNPLKGLAPSLSSAADHLDATAFHEKLVEPDTVVIDVRNHYEIDIGRFNGTEFLDPAMRVSTDFPGWARSQETKARLAGKQVLMYCTGGIRCERASGLIRAELGAATKGVFQLQGGIEKYLQAFPDGGRWQGKNFTFDKRGDLTRSTTDQSTSSSSSTQKNVLSACCVCARPWDTYLGKRKCAGPAKMNTNTANPSTTNDKAPPKTCGVPVLVCEPCLTNRVSNADLRCPLCDPSAKNKKRPPDDDVARAPPQGTATDGAKKKKGPKKKKKKKQPKAPDDAVPATVEVTNSGFISVPGENKKNKKQRHKKGKSHAPLATPDNRGPPSEAP